MVAMGCTFLFARVHASLFKICYALLKLNENNLDAKRTEIKVEYRNT